VALTTTWYDPGERATPCQLPELEPQLAIPIARDSTSNTSAKPKLRRLPMSSIPIIENGRSAKKMEREPGSGLSRALGLLLVLMDNVVVGVLVPSMETVAGENEHTTGAVPPEMLVQLNVIVPLKLLTGAMDRTNVAVPPWVTVMPVAFEVKV